MLIVEIIYLVVSGIFVISGLSLVVMGMRAYLETHRTAMVHLTVGFCLIVAAVLATVISGFLTGFDDVLALLLVQNSISTLGVLFVMYSLVSYA